MHTLKWVFRVLQIWCKYRRRNPDNGNSFFIKHRQQNSLISSVFFCQKQGHTVFSSLCIHIMQAAVCLTR